MAYKKSILVSLLVLIQTVNLFSQKPKIMVIPDDNMCKEKGCFQNINVDGKLIEFSDYAKLFKETKNRDIFLAIAKIQEIYSRPDINYPLVDLEKQITQNLLNKSQSTISNTNVSQLMQLVKVAQPDIILQLTYQLKPIPSSAKNQLFLTLKATDIASQKTQVVSEKSDPADPNVSELILLEETILKVVEDLNVKIQLMFDDVIKNGREITVEFKTNENSKYKLTDKITVNEKEMDLQRVVKAVIAKLDHPNNTSQPTCIGDDKEFTCDQIRIPRTYTDPIFGEEVGMTAKDFGDQIVDLLSTKFNIKAEATSFQLGNVRILIK